MIRTRKVVLHIETGRQWGRELLKGIASYARIKGNWDSRIPDFYVRPGNRDWKHELELYKNWGVQGIITREEKQLDVIIKSSIPTVVVSDSYPVEGIPRVISDYAATGKMAAEYFLNQGFTKFAFCGFNKDYWSLERMKGFQEHLAQRGFSVNIYEGRGSKSYYFWEKEIDHMTSWVRSLPTPVGLMVCCDLRGQHVAETCRLAERLVPEQVAILGVDNDLPLCDITNPKLSSIAMNTAHAGYEAAELLEKLMSGQEKPCGQQIIVKPLYVVTRQSSDILCVENPDLARALNFIKQYSHRQISVNDVVAASCISRRSLEDKFNKYLHRSVLSEIRRVRTDRFAQMLLETNLSIPQIAAELNFPSIENVGRYFERETGMRPSAYRKKYSHWSTAALNEQPENYSPQSPNARVGHSK